MYKNTTLKGLNIELKSNLLDLKQNIKESALRNKTIDILQESYRTSQDNIYLIRVNIERSQLVFTERSITSIESHITMIKQAIRDYKEPSYINIMNNINLDRSCI